MTINETRTPRLPRQRTPSAAAASAFRPAFEQPEAPLPGPTARVQDRTLSRMLTERLDRVVPAGSFTAARGTAAYPTGVAPVVSRGQGAHVWDVDGNRYVELGSGLGAVALGHGHHRVTDAVRATLAMGESFARPAAVELDAAETLLAAVPSAEMVAFVGGDAEALDLARATSRTLTGRDPLVLDAAVGTDGDLRAARRTCDDQGALLVLDERATAFRRTAGEASVTVQPDLRLFGGALGNGFAVAAVTGPRSLMRHAHARRGAETHALAAATAVLEAHRKEDVVATLDWVGRFLAEKVYDVVGELGLTAHLRLVGPPCDLDYEVLGADGTPSAELRSLFLGELLDRGVLAPSFVVSTALSDSDVQHVADGVHHAAQALLLALTDGPEQVTARHRR